MEDAHPSLTAQFLLKLGYAALFIVVLPAVLVVWAARLDELVQLPAYGTPVMGALVASLGIALAAWAVAALWMHGRGLPMSPFPPEHYVTRGPYRFVRHPIYVGAVLLGMGVSLGFRSAAGLWILTPVLALACVAWVLGFERDLTRQRFGSGLPRPLLHLPVASDEAPTAWDRASAYPLLFVPWLVLYMSVEFLGTPPDAIVGWMQWDAALPVVPWTEVFYLLTYPFVLAAPLIARRQATLRRFMIRGWTAMALILPIYLLLPIVAPDKPVPGEGVLQWIMHLERSFNEGVTAFPAFHVVWPWLAALVYAERWPRMSVAWGAIVAIIAVSSVTTGMHAIVDILGAVVAVAIILNASTLFNVIRRLAERLANSWHEVAIGPVRFINHGLYPAIGTWLGVLLIMALVGDDWLPAVVGVALASVAGAGIWAQFVEGSPQLLRPYGYFGGIVGGILGVVAAESLGAPFWLLFAGSTVGASLAQAIGRMRCLVQGCCHGSPAPPWLGIRFVHPRSRVTRLSALGGQPLHPTQLYSMGWLLVMAAVLTRLWVLGTNLELIVGMYFILAGLGRFVEEHYRGEPQTVIVRGLRLYQWLAIAFVVIGLALSMMGSMPAPSLTLPSATTMLVTTGLSVIVYAAFGADFPRLNARFSRLV